MDDLLQKTRTLLDAKYKRPIHMVSAVLVAKNGSVYSGMNVDHFTGFVCAEAYVLALAINAGETEFDSIAAMRKSKDGEVTIANACGKCRQQLYDYAPGIKVVVQGDGEPLMVPVEELLPYAFTNQRKKIQTAMFNESADEVIG